MALQCPELFQASLEDSGIEKEHDNFKADVYTPEFITKIVSAVMAIGDAITQGDIKITKAYFATDLSQLYEATKAKDYDKARSAASVIYSKLDTLPLADNHPFKRNIFYSLQGEYYFLVGKSDINRKNSSSVADYDAFKYPKVREYIKKMLIIDLDIPKSQGNYKEYLLSEVARIGDEGDEETTLKAVQRCFLPNTYLTALKAGKIKSFADLSLERYQRKTHLSPFVDQPPDPKIEEPLLTFRERTELSLYRKFKDAPPKISYLALESLDRGLPNSEKWQLEIFEAFPYDQRARELAFQEKKEGKLPLGEMKELTMRKNYASAPLSKEAEAEIAAIIEFPDDDSEPMRELVKKEYRGDITLIESNGLAAARFERAEALSSLIFSIDYTENSQRFITAFTYPTQRNIQDVYLSGLFVLPPIEQGLHVCFRGAE